jgi:hypothetical protein
LSRSEHRVEPVCTDPSGPGVIRRSAPADPLGAMTKIEIPFAPANDLPAHLFFGVDGVIDLPYWPLALPA